MCIRLRQLHCACLCRDNINDNHTDIDYNIHDKRSSHHIHDHNHHAASLPGWLPWLRQIQWHLCRGWRELAM